MLKGIPPAVPRAAQIDFRTAGENMIALEKVYAEDIDADAMSDEAIAAVNTTIRSIEGAMGKVAHGVYVKHCTQKATTYFPITDNPADFPGLLGRNLPGLAEGQPEVAQAFERHQPYHEGKQPLALLKALYRENHHHDFTVQEPKKSESRDFLPFPGMEISITDSSLTLGAPQWKGVSVERQSWDVGEPGGMEFHESQWLDWYFVDPPVSVLGTLISIYNLSAEACNEIAERADL